MRYELYVSSGEFKLPNLEVKSRHGETLEVKWNRNYFKGLSKLIREIELQYQGAYISRKSHFLLAIRNQLSVFWRNPKLGLFEIIFGYTGVVEIPNFSHFPLRILPKTPVKNLWISRNAITGGVFSPTFGADIEWDRLRYSRSYPFFVWGLKPCGASHPSGNDNHYALNRTKVSLSPSSLSDINSKLSALRYQTIENGFVYNGIFTLKQGEVYLIDASNGIEDISWPTNKVFKSGDVFEILTYPNQDIIHIPRAIILGSSSSWYHFIVEVVPRFIFLPPGEVFDHVVIVRGVIPESIQEVINFLGFKSVYNMFDGQQIFAESLITVSDFRYQKPLEIEQRKDDLISVRNFFMDSQENGEATRYIYLKRNQKLFRPLWGQKKFESFLIQSGFEVISPEQLSFSEQMKLFAHAKFVVSLSGAALTNMLFMPPTSVVVEINPGRDPLKLWSRFAKTIGVELVLFEGRPFRLFNALTGIGMFRINHSKFKKFITLNIHE